MVDAAKGTKLFVPKNHQAISEKDIHTAAGNPKGLFLTFYELTNLLNMHHLWKTLKDTEINENFVEFAPNRHNQQQMLTAVSSMLNSRRVMLDCLSKLIEFESIKREIKNASGEKSNPRFLKENNELVAVSTEAVQEVYREKIKLL